MWIMVCDCLPVLRFNAPGCSGTGSGGGPAVCPGWSGWAGHHGSASPGEAEPLLYRRPNPGHVRQRAGQQNITSCFLLLHNNTVRVWKHDCMCMTEGQVLTVMFDLQLHWGKVLLRVWPSEPRTDSGDEDSNERVPDFGHSARAPPASGSLVPAEALVLYTAHHEDHGDTGFYW